MEKLFYPKMLSNDAASVLGKRGQSVLKQLHVHKLDHVKSANRVFFGHKTAKEVFKYEFKRKVISFQIVKGGTGKTSLAQSVAVRASLYGARVLCVDIDQQANLTESLGIYDEGADSIYDILSNNCSVKDAIITVDDGLDLIPSTIENAALDSLLMVNRIALDKVFTKLLKPVIENYDLIVFDCPPSLGQAVSAAALASDLIVSPVTPERFSTKGLKLVLNEVATLNEEYGKNIDIKILLNKFDSRTSLSHETLKALIKNPVLEEKLIETYVRASQEIPNVLHDNKTIWDSIRPTPAKEDIDVVTRELLGV